jgi:predicted  nucleic acid-binding Zn-ribbon protein
MIESAKLIIISDLLDTKARKEKELAFYNEQLRELQGKMFWVQKEIDLTTDIIDMIEKRKDDGSTTMDERKKRMNTQQHIQHLQHEITVLKDMIKEHGTGHIHTAIYVLENRIKELELLIEEVLDSSYPDGDGYWK